MAIFNRRPAPSMQGDVRSMDREALLVARRDVAMVLQTRKRLEMELVAEQRRLAEWESIAEQARRQGNEAGVREAGNAKVGAQTRIADLTRQQRDLAVREKHGLDHVERIVARMQGREAATRADAENPLSIDRPPHGHALGEDR